MTKYKPLSDRLTGHSNDEWRASFAEVEEVLGFPLPKGARSGRTWWANDGDKGHHKAWGGVGWLIGDVDPATGYVTFRRAEASGSAPEPQVAEPSEVQPEVMRKASSRLSRSNAFRDVAPAAIVAGVAVVAGLAAFMTRKAFRKAA